MAISVPQRVKDLIREEEGFRPDVYPDSEGYSAGHGHFLSEEELKKYPPGTKVPRDQLDAWFEEDIAKSYAAAQAQNAQLPQALDVGRLTSVNYQLGESWNDISVNPKAFKETWAMMQAGDYSGAATEVLDSDWAKQTPGRTKKFSDALASLGQGPAPTPLGDPGADAVVAASGPATSPQENPLFALITGGQPGTRTRNQFNPRAPRASQPRVQDTSFLPPMSPAPQSVDSRVLSTSASQLDLSGVLAAKVFENRKYEAGVAEARQSRGDTTPTLRYTTEDVWSGSVQAGAKQLSGDVQQFGAIFNLVTGDQEKAEARLNRAERLHRESGDILNSMGTFEEFLDAPTFDGFFTQVVKSLGQFTPMAISSVASGFTGMAIGAAGKGLLTATSRKVTREVVSDILKKKIAHKKGLGPALDETEEAILSGAYAGVKKANMTLGQMPRAGIGQRVPGAGDNFPFLSAGFWAGAGGQEYVVGSSQALGEYREAGYKLTAEEAKAALALGIPQALIGTLGERLFVGALFKGMARKYAKTGDKEAAGWMMEVAKGFGGGLLKGGVTEGVTETAQEELFIQQRFAIDSDYTQQEANLRRAESAFAGFWAGGGRSAPTQAIANVIGKARNLAQNQKTMMEERDIARKKGQSEGRVLPEPRKWSQAQAEALLDEDTDTKAVWLPTDGLNETDRANVLNDFLDDLGDDGAGYSPTEIDEKFAIIQDEANKSGFLILDRASKTSEVDAKDAIDSGFSEIFLKQVLGYTEVSDPSHDAVVQVKNVAGNVVWQQTTSEADVDAVKAHARARFKNESKYRIEGVTREAAFDERQQAGAPQQPEAPAPEQGEFDFGGQQQTEGQQQQTEGQQQDEEGLARPFTAGGFFDEEASAEAAAQQAAQRADAYARLKAEAEGQQASPAQDAVIPEDVKAGDEINIFDAAGNPYTATVTVVSEFGAVKVLNQAGENVILGDDLSATTVNVNNPAYTLESVGPSITSITGKTRAGLDGLSETQLAELEIELEKRVATFPLNEGALRPAVADLNAVKLRRRKNAAQDGPTTFTERSMAMEGQAEGTTGTIYTPEELTELENSEGVSIQDEAEGRLTDPVLKKNMEGKTEQQIAEARANRPVSAWPPRDLDERAETNDELDARETAENFFLEYQAEEQGVESLKRPAEVEALLSALPTALLERFMLEARQDAKDPDSNRVLTPKPNPDTGNWEIRTSPRDAMSRNTDTLSPAERIRNVVINASRHKNRNRTPGWSVRDPDGKTRAVYMGNLVHFGLAIRAKGESFTKGTGRVIEGFNNVYQVLQENDYEILYKGEPIGDLEVVLREKAAAEPTAPGGQQQQETNVEAQLASLASLGFDSQSFIEARAQAKIEYETESPVHREGTESGRDRVGQHRWARRNPRTGVIHINEKILEQKFKDKAWTEPKKGVNPLPEDAFSTLAEFREFIILHEVGHGLVRRVQGAPGGPTEFNESYGAHENRINDGALLVARTTQQQETAPTTEAGPPLNIWAGTNENAELSNLAVRPFEGTQGRRYQSVEHAYQSLKSGQFDQTVYNNPRWGKTPVKIIGRKGTKTEGNWNIRLMEGLMRASFEQNPDAQQALINTGNAVLTHTQDRGVWRTKFPEILIGLRTEFQGEVAQETAPTAEVQTPVVKVISGGQTGADIIFSKVAKALGLETGGLLPKGFQTLAGKKPGYAQEFNMEEDSSPSYPPRTRKNVANSDGTIILVKDPNNLGQGSTLTKNTATQQGKPYLVITPDTPASTIRTWLNENNIKTLNGAGSSVRGSYRDITGQAEQTIVSTLTEVLSTEAAPTKPKFAGADVQKAAWQDARIFDLGRGNLVSFNEAQQGRQDQAQDPRELTDAQLREELAAIEAKLDARQRYFDERAANPALPASQTVNQYVAVTEAEMDRKSAIENQLNKGFQDPADFVGEINPEGEFAPGELNLDDPKHAPILTSLELQTQATKRDILGPPQVIPSPGKKGEVEIDASWSSVMGGLWPQLSSILTSKLGYGRRATIVTTAQSILKDGFKYNDKYGNPITVMQGDQKVSISDVVKNAVAKMKENGELGKYIRFADTDLIIIDVPANPTAVQQVKAIYTLGHEIGHAMFHQEMERSLNNPKLRNDLMAAWKLDVKVSEQYQGKFGFEEWFADNMGGWLLREAKKPTNAVESFFYRLTEKIRAVFDSIDANLRRRFSQNESFDLYVQDVIKSYKGGIQANTGMSIPNKVIVRNMVDELAVTVKPFMPKKLLQQVKQKIVALLSVKEELMPNDKRHWSVAYFLQPAHNYLRKFSPELASVFYSMSQSEERAGTLNARVLLMYQRLNELNKLAPTKKTLTGKSIDLDAWEPTLLAAEDDRIPTNQLSPEARKVRQYLEDFYENYIRGEDKSVGKLKHFYPRILALAEIQANPEIKANVVELLKEFNPKGPKGVLIDAQGKDISSFEAIVDALVRDGQSNPDDVIPDVADVALGTSEARAKYFKNIPNSRLREIGALEAANTSIRRYVEDMTKRLDYLDKSRAILTAEDMGNIKDASKGMQNSFSKAKIGDEVRGWKATEVMLLRIPNETDRAAARDAVKAMLGKTGLGMSPVMRTINSVALSVNIMTYLTFATLASLPDLAGPILRSKDLSWDNLREGTKQVRRYFTETQEMQQFARDIGVVTFDSLNTSLMQSSELGHMTPAAQRASDIFFRAIGLEWFTNFTRVFAAGMGEQFLIRQANLNTDRSSRYLRELEVSREDIKAWDQNGRTFGTPEGKRVQMALGRFVEESIVRPNAAERPVWASNPYTAIVWQLKSFFYAYGKNVVGGAMRESKNRYAEDGTLTSASIPLVLGALTILPLTMMGLEIREWLKYLGRGGDEMAFRSDNMPWGEYSGDIIDRAGILGPFGLILPIIEAGEFGKSWWVPPFGPTAERLEDAFRGKATLYDYLPGVGALR